MAEERTAVDVARILADALERGGLPYAVGGALALAFYAPPRATIDVDLNVFVSPHKELDRVLSVLKEAAFVPDEDGRSLAEHAQTEGQFRGHLSGLRVDVFVPAIPYYAELEKRRRQVALLGRPLWILGPEDRLPWPPGADEVDYQVEVACIVGQFCRDVSLDDAPDLIFGYTLMNDWVGRTRGVATRGRRHRPRVDRFATSLGPCVVTADEFDPARGRLVARVDGDVWSEGDLRSAQGTFPQLLAQFSAQQDMYPGDVLGSGTFPGGCATDLGRTLRPGATVELEAEGIGALRNRVGFPEETLQPAAGELTQESGAP